MKIQILSSGSKGNCYKISDGETALLLECGIPIQELKKKLNFDLSDIAGCLITHEHMDHAKAVKDLLKLGIDCYMTSGTREILGLRGLHVISLLQGMSEYRYHSFRIGTMIVQPFQVIHDAKEPIGFVIKSEVTNETLLFMTDTMYSFYLFHDMDYMMLEVNYIKEVINDNKIHPGLRKRIKENHMSLETALVFLKACDLSRTKEIYIMHLSDNNSDEEYIKTEIQKVTGKVVTIC